MSMTKEEAAIWMPFCLAIFDECPWLAPKNSDPVEFFRGFKTAVDQATQQEP